MANYSQVEAQGAMMPVVIEKAPNASLANPVTFRVVPITEADALSQGVITADDVPAIG